VIFVTRLFNYIASCRRIQPLRVPIIAGVTIVPGYNWFPQTVLLTYSAVRLDYDNQDFNHD